MGKPNACHRESFRFKSVDDLALAPSGVKLNRLVSAEKRSCNLLSLHPPQATVLPPTKRIWNL